MECAEKSSDPAVYYKCFDSTKSNEEEERGGGSDFLPSKPADANPGEAAPAPKDGNAGEAPAAKDAK